MLPFHTGPIALVLAAMSLVAPTQTHPVSLSSALLDDKGFHLKLHTRVLNGIHESCLLTLQFLFPPGIYADPYELEEQLPHHRINFNDTVNLEYPMGTNSTSLWTQLQVSLPSNSISEDEALVIPIHLRYCAASTALHRQLELPQPIGSWSCSEGEQDQFLVR